MSRPKGKQHRTDYMNNLNRNRNNQTIQGLKLNCFALEMIKESLEYEKRKK